MKKRITYLFLCLMTTLVSSYATKDALKGSNQISPPFKMPSSKTIYGFLYYDYDYGTKGFVSFSTSSTNIINMFSETSKDICAGAYADNTYYAYFTEYDDDYGTYIPSSLSKVDMKTGNITQIVAMNYSKPLLNDMTYDYSSQTMFGIKQVEGEFKSTLVKLNLTTGTITDIAKLEYYFATIACSYTGTLYGISSSGNFYKINKANGTATFIGQTEEEPYSKQSMEFDHDTNTLYWSCVNMNYQSFLATIDVNTGMKTTLGNLGDHAQITGLYIPFDNVNAQAPARITDFLVQPGENGLLTAQLSWTNPIKTHSGSTLSEITSIGIYRNELLIHTITGTPPGGKVNWTDHISAKGSYSYKIIPVNSIGNGPGSSYATYIGRDIPCAVSNFKLTAENNIAKLSWSSASQGLNNGWIDVSSLKYRIIRLPDNAVITENATGTSYEDKTIKNQGLYSYKIISLNNDGEGGEAISNTEKVGSAMYIPYYYDFESSEDFKLWTVIDANKDEYIWKIDTETLMSENHIARYYTNRNKNADDWMITPTIYLETGKDYIMKFKVSSFQEKAENLKVTIGEGASIENQTKLLADYKGIINKPFELKTIHLNIDKTGNYNIGFYCYSPSEGAFLYLDDFSIEEYGSKDFAATSIKGNLYPLQNKKYDYAITVKNTGVTSQNYFTLKLIDENQHILTSSEFDDILEPNQEKEFILSWTPANIGKLSIHGSVELVSDVNSGNNNTTPLAIEVRPEGGIDLIKVGDENKQTNSLPVNFSFKTSTSQTIYLKEELGLSSGLIKKIIYPYSFTRDDISNKPIKIYLANTFESSLKEDFIQKENFTLVFEGKISIPKNKNQLEIELTTPFLYSGQNLVVMCERIMDVDGYLPGIFYVSSVGNKTPYRTRIYSDDLKPFTFQPKAGRVYNTITNVIFGIDTESGGIISGTMIDDYEDPVLGAIVKIPSLNTIAKADNNGKYQFNNVPEGTYTLSMKHTGHYDLEWSDVQVTNGNTVSLYLEMERMGKCTVRGIVTKADGTPLSGAQIKISGYAEFNTESNPDGSFEIEEVFVNSQYTITVTSSNLKEYKTSFATSDNDKDLGSIKMIDVALPVCNINHATTESGMQLQWGITNSIKKFRRDDGSVYSQLGADNPYQIFGTSYRDFTVLYNMSWQTTDNMSKHDKVNLFVFALDREGNPTSEILYSKKDVPNTDWKWCTHTFEVPVEAPNGFLIALTSDIPLDLATDAGDSQEYPFVNNTNYTGNYLINVFTPLENLLYFENLHLRAEGAVKSEAKAEACKGYYIWRLKSGQESSYDKWTKLTKEPISNPSYIDSEWNQIEPGLYRFAITSLYTGNVESPVNMTNVIPNKMLAQVNFTVRTNTSAKYAKGAIVSLTNTDGMENHKYRAWADETGKVAFKDIWKGTYTVEIVHSDFEYFHSENNDFSTEDEYSKEVTVKEKIYSPFNLEIKEDSTKNQRIFNWNVSKDIFDNFENHVDFAINSAGKTGWQYIDGDGQNTLMIGSNDFASNGKKMAYTIFNPSATKPSLSQDNSGKPFSGSKFLACFNSLYIANDDYLISPNLNFDTEFTFSFMGKSYSNQYALSEIMVGYSLTGKAAKDFIWITSDPVKVDANSWVKYEYDIPARAAYIALRCVSMNSFLLMVDDVFIGKSNKNNASTTYEVYLDGEKVGQSTFGSYTFNELNEGTHTAGVKAVYETGSSETSTINFEVNYSGIDRHESGKSGVWVYPNPAKGDSFTLTYEGTPKGNILIYSQSGILVKQINTTGLPADSSLVIDTKDLNPGVYILRIHSEEYHSLVKLIVEK